MTAPQTLLQRVAELETENRDLAQYYSHDMTREVERLTIKLAEFFLHRHHLADAPNYQYALPYQIFFGQFPLPIAIYRTDGTLVAMNEQHTRRFQSAYNALNGYSNVFADPQTDCPWTWGKFSSGNLGRSHQSCCVGERFQSVTEQARIWRARRVE